MNVNPSTVHHIAPTQAPVAPIRSGVDNTAGKTTPTTPQTPTSNPSHLGNFVDTTA
jgi:hypothetical protein